MIDPNLYQQFGGLLLLRKSMGDIQPGQRTPQPGRGRIRRYTRKLARRSGIIFMKLGGKLIRWGTEPLQEDLQVARRRASGLYPVSQHN